MITELFYSYNLNFLKLLFIFFFASLSFVGIFVNWFEQYLPSIILESYRYGKLSRLSNPSLRIGYVPKSWFRHFYVFSSFTSFLSLLLLFLIYFNYLSAIPKPFILVLTSLGGPASQHNVTSSAAFLSMFLMTVHCWRRFYETHFVSVFSNSKMSVGIYFVGILHYFGAILAILCEAPGILNEVEDKNISNAFSLSNILAIIVFLWANKTQYDAAVILGRLRKNDKGKIKTTKHFIPTGKYFELVSCPHLMCEIVIYLCLWTILWGNTIWPYVTSWVIVNQVECALLCHWWYKETFSNYPKKRKAIIPFLL